MNRPSFSEVENVITIYRHSDGSKTISVSDADGNPVTLAETPAVIRKARRIFRRMVDRNADTKKFYAMPNSASASSVLARRSSRD